MKRKELPERVLQKIDQIREERKIYADVKFMKNGVYYAYRGFMRWDPARNKHVSASKYLGRITENGEFIEARRRNSSILGLIMKSAPIRMKQEFGRLSSLYGNLEIQKIEDDKLYLAVKKPKGMEFIGTIDEYGRYDPAKKEMPKEEEKDLLLLQCLSMDSRISYKKMAKIAGLKDEHEAYSKVKSLVKRLAIHYTADIDIRKFNYSPFMLFVKFKNGKPKTEDLKSVLAGNPKVQFASLTEGKYDAVAYIIDESFMIYSTLVDIFTDQRLELYGMDLTITPFYIGYGFIPLRDVFFDNVLIEKVWKKKRNEKHTTELLERERIVLREIVINGGIDFAEIDKRYNLGHGAAHYTFRKLKQNGFIYRETINMKGIAYRYIRAVIVNTVNMRKFTDSRDSLLQEIITNNGPINKYAFVGDIGAPVSVILFQPVLSDNDNTQDQINEKVKGIETETMVVTNVLVGEFALIRYDYAYSSQYEILAEHNKVPTISRIDY